MESDAVVALIARLSPGERLFVPGSAAEIPALWAGLCAPDAPAFQVTTTLVPGINATPNPTGPLSNPFALRRYAPGVFRHLPLSYGGFLRALTHMEFDTCILHVAAPDARGHASLGPSVEFTPIALSRARRFIAVVNPQLPALPGAVSVDLAGADLVVEIDAGLRAYEPEGSDPVSVEIARIIAGFVPDGAALQYGLGKIPDALAGALRRHRGLRLHSGMLSDGMRDLMEANALDEDFVPVSCVHVGSAAHYGWLRDRPRIAVRPVSETHAPGALARLGGLVAVNGALSVDLFGQANLETAGGRAVSGVGGAADFARAASLDPMGISIIGLPSITPKGESRIVTMIEGPCSLPRHDVDVVVTEHGAADLRGADVETRAERLIAIAAPEHQASLSEAFHAAVSRLYPAREMS
ncbi:acetyl-CoA hydrolase/transferase family protein [Chelatococcus asaccharovorans]|nr:acetyl-CoA hydrolase/transferase C-terminal domain-containing protein [Chelatococcus asaccharovorans]MBS7708140.1 hypothetical protein [Chelatococcus asaccharovorans]